MDKNVDIDWESVEKELEQAIDKIQYLGLTIEIVGNWLWLSGKTKPYAHDLREAGYQWSKTKNRWFYRPKCLPYRAKGDRDISMEQIRAYYGSHVLNSATH